MSMIEYNREYNDKIRKICEENPTSYANVFNGKNNHYLSEYIFSCTKDVMPLDKKVKLAKRINFVLKEFQCFPKCKNPECNNIVSGVESLKWYEDWTEHCCNKCAQRDPVIKTRVKQRKLEKYGSENYNGNKEDIIRKNRERYGADWFFESEEGKRKIKEGWMKNGYDHPMHSKEIKDGMSDRYMKKHGVPYSCLNPEVIKKAKSPYFYNGIYFKSSWELAYYIFLQDNGITFEYQPDVFFEYIDDNGKKRYYFPDFRVDGNLIEIKGDQFITKEGKFINPYDSEHKTDGIYEAKRKCMVEHGVRIISENEIKEILKFCSSKFSDSNWKLRFKVKERPKNSILDIKKLEIDMDFGNMMKEFEYFKNKIPNDSLNGYCSKNCIVKYFQQDVFYKKEKYIWENDEILRNKLIENRCKYLNKKIEELTVNDILNGFKYSGIHYGYSHFNPLWFKWFIDKYDVKTCYDPCGGWGHRLLGGLSLEKYIYNDLTTETKRNVDKMIEFFKIKNVKTYNEDCRTFIPEEKFESMFTCVPYFNLEHYGCGDFKDIEEYNDFLDSIFEVFKNRDECRIFGLVIREDYLTDKHQDYRERFKITLEKNGHLTKKKNCLSEYLYVYEK